MADTNDNHIEIPIPSIQGMDEILKPNNRPVMGNQRLVRFLPLLGVNVFPAIWISPYTTKEIIDKEGTVASVVKCILLISKGPPKPEIACVSIRPEDLTKCPMAPVEW